MHRVSVKPFLDKWEARAADKARLAQDFDVALLGKCDSCQACKDDCPVCKVDPTFDPCETIGRLLDGDIEDVLDDPNIWKCLECYTCLELCHSEIGMAEMFRKLKELSLANGTGPESVPAQLQDVHGHRPLGKPKEGARKKLGLEPLPASGASDEDSWHATPSMRCVRQKERTCDGVRTASRADADDPADRFSDRENVFDQERPAYREEASFKIHGGCGLMGICDESGTLMSGENAIRAMAVQRDRGNGLGGATPATASTRSSRITSAST